MLSLSATASLASAVPARRTVVCRRASALPSRRVACKVRFTFRFPSRGSGRVSFKSRILIRKSGFNPNPPICHRVFPDPRALP